MVDAQQELFGGGWVSKNIFKLGATKHQKSKATKRQNTGGAHRSLAEEEISD